MDQFKCLLRLITFAVAFDGAGTDSRNDICPKSLQQKFKVPWLDQLNPNIEFLFLRENIGRLRNYPFVRSSNLKVCVLQKRTC